MFTYAHVYRLCGEECRHVRDVERNGPLGPARGAVRDAGARDCRDIDACVHWLPVVRRANVVVVVGLVAAVEGRESGLFRWAPHGAPFEMQARPTPSNYTQLYIYIYVHMCMRVHIYIYIYTHVYLSLSLYIYI